MNEVERQKFLRDLQLSDRKELLKRAEMHEKMARACRAEAEKEAALLALLRR